MQTAEMIHAISSGTIEELDNAIAALKRIRQSRAEYVACASLKPGQSIKWKSYNVGEYDHFGAYDKPDTKSGFVRVTNVTIKDADGKEDRSFATHIVDAGIIALDE